MKLSSIERTASRKSTLGRVLDLPAEARLEATLVTNAIGIANGSAKMPYSPPKPVVTVPMKATIKAAAKSASK
jgi:hypothetical protein